MARESKLIRELWFTDECVERLTRFTALCRADLIESRDTYQREADKLAGENNALRGDLFTSIAMTQASLEELKALRQAYGLLCGSSK